MEKRFEAEAAFLIGKPVSDAWMPEENLDKVARLEGVERVSPQIYLQSLTGTPFCSAEELYIVAFDPKTDFTIQPWLKERLRPFTVTKPKVMLSIAGKPILCYVVESLAGNGIRNIVLVVGYRREQVFDSIGSGEQLGVEITYITQERQTLALYLIGSLPP